jgi:opacity protein-like surface antigen
MKKLLFATALASSMLVAAPAVARDSAFYVELDGGVMKVEDFDFDIGTTNNAATLENDDIGYDFGGIVGYDFGALRIEGEVGYRGVDNDQLTSTVRIPSTAANLTFAGSAPAGTFNAGGDTTAFSLMLNGLVDFGDDDGLQFFAGGGVGKAKVDVDTSILAGGPGFIDDDDWGLAWQLLAGVRAPLSDNIDVGVKYRFFNVRNVDFTDTAGRDIDADWRSHSLLGTFTANFGGRSEPMPEVAPAPTDTPPPPPPPQAPVYTPPPAPEPTAKPGERG